jgi:hypothetical protein
VRQKAVDVPTLMRADGFSMAVDIKLGAHASGSARMPASSGCGTGAPGPAGSPGVPALMRLLTAAGMVPGPPSVLPRLFLGEFQVRTLADVERACREG